MKSLWVWIVGIVIAVLIFSGEKEGNTSVPTTYNQQPQPPVYQQPTIPAYSSPAFMGYRCTVDCSGHEAGYEWAGENGIDDPNDCDGNSNSFIEGCQAYAEEQQAAMGETTDEE